MRRTVADRLTDARRRALVGREEELRRAARFLDDEGPAVLHVHGPGGVGKSTLLRAVEDLSIERDRDTRRVDCHDLAPDPESVLTAVAGRPEPAEVAALPRGTVLLLDHAESLGSLEAWLWRTLLPSLPDDCRLVLASRRPPPHDVRAPEWRDVVEVLALRNLSPTESETLLRVCGVPDDVDVTAIVRATHGHPLALVIAADEYAERGDVGGGSVATSTLLEHPDAAARLLGSFVDDVADPLQRQALHVIGHARRVDRALLTAVLDLDPVRADDLLEWLRERPYAQSHPDGLSVHDVVRDALDRDLRWRDRHAFVTLHRRIRDVVLHRLATTDGVDHARAAADLLFLHRGNPDAEDLWGFDDLLALTRRRATPQDRPAVLAAFEAVDGAERAAAVAGWLDHEAATFHVVVDAADSVTGVIVEIRLDRIDPTPVADPLPGLVRAELARRRPPEAGEVVLLTLVADGRDPDSLGGFSDQVAAWSLKEWATPRLGWVVVASTRVPTWAPLWEYLGFEPLGELAAGDRTLGFWARDFARSDYAAWLEALLVRELDDDGSAPPPVSAPVALAREDFDAAVRQVLRDHARPERLRDNPLLSSRLARGEDPVAALRDVVARAVAAVRRQARGELPAAAVDRTHLRPAATQELAAEVRGVPFGTYRRHLRAGVERVTEVLWDWELHGVPPEVDRN